MTSDELLIAYRHLKPLDHILVTGANKDVVIKRFLALNGDAPPLDILEENGGYRIIKGE